MDIELGKGESQKSLEQGLEAFFKKVQEIEKLLDNLSTLLHRLQDANEESKTVTNASSMKTIKQRMANDVDDVGKNAGNIRIKLEELDRENLLNRNKPGCGKGTSGDRLRMIITAALKKKLKDRMADFQVLRQTIQSEYRETIERRVFTVTGVKPDEEMIDNLKEAGNGEQIFQKAIQEMGRMQVLDTLEEIQERHDTVKEIDKKLLHLHQVIIKLLQIG